MHLDRSNGMLTPSTRKKLKMQNQRRQRNKLRQLGMFIVLSFLVLAFFFTLISYARLRSIDAKSVTNNNLSTSQQHRLRGNQRQWVSQDSQPFNENRKASKATHLVMVAGHSVTVSGNLEDAGTDESVWYLLDYQKGRGLPQAIVAHIQAGIEQAARDPQSLLVFSGGETRAVTGPFTEGSSYFRVADAMDLWPNDSNVRARTVTEEFATDSFENLLFSICRFKEVTGSYPSKITVVSFTFKQRRFEQMHAASLQYPSSRFHYVGVDPPASTGFDLVASIQGELENAARPFEQDPYGCHSAVLQEKRRSRNPFARTPPYALSCPELKPLLQYCGPKPYPKSSLPWSNLQ